MLGDIALADALATDALAAYDALDYEQGVHLAAAAHRKLMAAAEAIHVAVDPEHGSANTVRRRCDKIFARSTAARASTATIRSSQPRPTSHA